jgi:hypothetical protein
MIFSLRSFFKATKHSRWVLYPLIAFAPLYMRPLGFVGPNKPMYARLKGLWGAPMFGAGLAAKGGYELFSWLYFQKASVGVGNVTAFERMKHITSYGGWGFFTIMAALIYGIALIRWGYHFVALTICRKFGLSVIQIPLLFFVVTTSTFGFWLGLMIRGMPWLYESNDAQGKVVTNLVSNHPHASFALVLAIGLSSLWAGENTRLGMAAAYANSGKVLMAVYLTPIPLVFLVHFAMTWC